MAQLFIKNQPAQCEHFTNIDLCKRPVLRICFPGPSTIIDPKLFCENHIQWMTLVRSKFLYFTIKRIRR